MPDLEKVIKGLECCSKGAVTPYIPTIRECADCPYNQPEIPCTRLLAEEALALLKAREPRVMTLEKMREGEVYWFDCPGNFILRPVICNMYDRGDSSYLNFVWQYGNFSWKNSEYGRTWRCWTSRPDQETREETPWN